MRRAYATRAGGSDPPVVPPTRAVTDRGGVRQTLGVDHPASKDQHPRVCVVYLLRDGPSGPEVLLGAKRRGLGEGRVVGPGGKLEPGETARDAAVREVAEEVGLLVRAEDLEARGSLDYRFPHRPAWSQRSDVFVATRWRGEPRGSDELDPRWVPVPAIPYDAMWDDARYWLPAVLDGGHVHARFTFGPDNATVAGFTGDGVRDTDTVRDTH
jgi:8-oxo-dGTP diphosphatase